MTAQRNPLGSFLPVTTTQTASLRLTAAWLPALLGVLVICGESTRVMGADHTMIWLSRLCMPLVHLANADMVELNHLLRKCGHFFGYGTLGLIFAQGWLALLRSRGQSVWANLAWAQKRLRVAGLAVLSTAVVASMDEIHQSFLPNRTACVSDVLLDTLGAVLMLTMVAAVLLMRRKRTLQERLQTRVSRQWKTGPVLFRHALLDA